MSVGADPGSLIVSGSPDKGAAGRRLEPLKHVRLLLPVWGEPFIVQFLNISLPTLLAPGNLPAVAADFPCVFVFLTNSDGAAILSEHPALECIRQTCAVEFEIIDDLITGDNYSTTLTLGFARAMRASGPAMLDTCFLFLISDYIMADGSLANVVKRVASGYSGVLAGNFQVVEEDAKESLLEMYETGEPGVALSARKLISWAFDYLHPMTLANTVNFPIYHSVHSNRLFWRVDANTLIGRFYLMHMIAIRPEVTEFEIGSSCDYSFIPELCPSGNVHVVAESDEYVVVEMQRRAHEERFIRLGATDAAALADSLAEWTTERHRLNAHTPVVYRASHASPGLQAAIAESRAYIEEIEARLPAPKPFRDHPYWIGAIAAHRSSLFKKRKAEGEEEPVVPAPVDTPTADLRTVLYWLRDTLFGGPTRLRPWHPRWPDYKMVRQLAERFLVKDITGTTLILSSAASDFENLLRGPGRSDESLNFKDFLARDGARYENLVGKYDGCLLVIRDLELDLTNELLSRIRPLLSVNDHLVVFVNNGQGLGIGEQFNYRVLHAAGRFFDRRVKLETVEFLSAGRLAMASLRLSRVLFSQSVRNPAALVISAIPMAAMLGVSIVGNVLRRRSSQPSGGLCSSICIVLKIMESSTERPAPSMTDLGQSYIRYLPKALTSLHSTNNAAAR